MPSAQARRRRRPGIDIFRFGDGTIVEHRDVPQIVPAEPRNDKGMF